MSTLNASRLKPRARARYSSTPAEILLCNRRERRIGSKGLTSRNTVLWGQYNNTQLRANQETESLEHHPASCAVYIGIENSHVVIRGGAKDGLI